MYMRTVLSFGIAVLIALAPLSSVLAQNVGFVPSSGVWFSEEVFLRGMQ